MPPLHPAGFFARPAYEKVELRHVPVERHSPVGSELRPFGVSAKGRGIELLHVLNKVSFVMYSEMGILQPSA